MGDTLARFSSGDVLVGLCAEASAGLPGLGAPAGSLDLAPQADQRSFIEQPADERDAMGTATLLEADGHRQ